MYTLTLETLTHLNGKDALQVTSDSFFLHAIQRTIKNQGEQNLNIDLQDFEYVLKPTGAALVGAAEANGPDRAIVSIQNALCLSPEQKHTLDSPLRILVGITTHQETPLAVEELDTISDYLDQVLGEYSDITYGMGQDQALAINSARIIIALSCLQGIPA